MFARSATGLLLLLGLAASALAAATTVRTFGTIRQLVAAHDASPKVALADVLRDRHAHGLGSLSDLRGEITILDGTAWLSYPPARPGDKPVVVAAADSPERAGFLVVATVAPAGWQQIRVTDPLSSDSFERILETSLSRHGVDGRDVPFRLDGRFETLTLAIVDGRKLPPGPSSAEAMKKANHLERHEGVDGTLVGFVAAKDDGRFTHAGTRVHAHAVVPSRRATGHARAFTLQAGSTLWVPARR